MIHDTNDNAAIRELSIEELDSVAGAKFSWGDLVGAMAAGAATGAAGGAAATGGPGAVPGAIGGGLLGGIGYCIKSIF
ncbi:MAG: hypothetical protein BGN91_14870 [Nitrobacter sp. 62-13]|jgi:hypothetical protein|uniref:hypothetical protein n=1 Tax=Nitrobacter sp. 62-13 TaxID=1895797 RepID=UPI000967FD66|nr:hypothetical protein [Nitrobacter sp. 62-13]OJU30622.1 MAG: hypothetical protein BGN91_14870 [Nitrobacter sp. 62-13]